PPAPAPPAPAPPVQTAPLRPAPFSSIGSQSPAVNPAGTVLGAPATEEPARTILGAPLAAAPLTMPVGQAGAVATKKRRRWPLLLLALLTIAGSGALSWGVATWVNDREPAVATESIALGDAATAQPAVEDTSSPTEPSPVTSQSSSAAVLDNEPFAQAAEIIRPSVVQLNLGQGLGTGVIIDADGTILTAAHVVGTNTDVRVTFADGSSAAGTVVGADEATDVAVVKVDPDGRSLVAAKLADGDDVRVGQLAVAVGSPFGFDQTVTAGIISAVDRIVNNVSMVQTDAPINPGNSGGPLINLQGEVVGINDLIFTESGSNAGVGFAISIDLAVIIAEQLIDGLEPRLALLGVSTGPPPDGARGAQVSEVVSGSAAEEAGFQVGDIVIALNGVDTRGSTELRAQVIDEAPGSSITIRVLRDGEQVDLQATLGQTDVESQ
ncbi:MAG: putative serine protease PepD, partial [Candidatus Poriferisodalaceae bacterium]